MIKGVSNPVLLDAQLLETLAAEALLQAGEPANRESNLSQGMPEASKQPRRCIHEMFEAQARKTPEAIALSHDRARLTYRELNERANQLAHYLRMFAVGPEILVALYLERSLEMAVAILAVLKAGGAYVPVDLAYPKERLSFMLEDTQAPVLITQEKLRASLPVHSTTVIGIDSEWNAISTHSTANPVNKTTSANAAYIIYTSGSTGKPKGVLVTHHNVVRLLTQTEHWYQFNANDVWSWFHSYAFDVSVFEMWGALFYGGRLVVVPDLVCRTPDAFYELLAREQVTVLSQTPSAFRQVIWADVSAQSKLPLKVRYVICAGEALELQSLKPWFDLHGDEQPKIVNMYGITETTVHSMYRVIRQEDLANGVGSVIGVPIPDLQIHLLDENLKPVPSGVPGEICVGGAGVARGYLNRPELTRQRFIPDPFSSQPGATLYRSGDLAQFSATGEMEYLGRMDHQVKIRGFRVELGEIASALNQHPAVRESAVVAHAASRGDKRLVAYIVPRSAAPTITELREHLAVKLPEYMIPATFMFLESLPLTTNGKLDRRALPAPDHSRPQLKEEFVAPRNESESTLAKIWSEVLEIEKIGIHDNYFELGGDSIRSIVILYKAQQAGLTYSLQQLFRHPTVAKLAACANAFSSEKPAAERPQPFGLVSAKDRAKLPAGLEDAYPLAKLQLGMFFHNEMNPLSAMYHDVFSYRVRAVFDREKLERAIRQLVARHATLRTSFHVGGFSEPLQLVYPSVGVPFSVEDLRQLSPEDQNQRLVDWVEVEKRNPFDRTAAPLIRFHAQWQSEKSFQLILSFHHACLDGWSLAAAVTEILQDYTRLLQGTSPATTAPRVTYRDFVALEKQSIESEECRRFWTGQIQDATVQMLPRWSRPDRAGGHEQVRGPEIFVEPEVLAGLRSLAQTAGVPLKSVLLAAHQRVMSLLYGQDDVISGLVCNGRPEEKDGEKLVGLFLNTLPCRLRLKSDANWVELAKDIFAVEQELISHRRFPLAEVQKLNGGQPLFETAFDFVHFHVFNNLQDDNTVSVTDGHYFEANNLTTYTVFILDVTSTRLEVHVDYYPNMLCREQVEQITTYYVETLQAMASDPRGRYDIFSPLSKAEQQKLLVEWNATEEDYPKTARIHELFEARAAETPQAIAAVFGNETLTYRELNERANRLARRLAELHAGPEVLVGIYLERSLEMLVGLLGILKAGAAYVPLDPAFPKQRLAQIISDAQMPLILTQEKLVDTLPHSAARILTLAADDDEKHDPPTTVSRDVSSEQLAYVIYTSGSTGQPKGVQISHRAVVNVLTSIGKTCDITAKDNLLAVTTLSFDIAALEIFLPLIVGGKVTIASRETASDGTRLSALIESSAATVMQATPATWRLLFESRWTGNRQLKVLCGGEALTRKLADQLLSSVVEVWNVYGPTETTIWSTSWKVVPDESISIGRPLANTQIYVLDKNLQPTPVGVAGELHIGGDGLARAYFKRPELTEEKFIANPFSDKPGDRLYKTGDLARRLPDGTLECLGRIDHQVKIRGFRVELGEIETVLRQHHAVKEALVTAQETGFEDKRLVGYLLGKNGVLPVNELRDFVTARLPSYMVPAQLVLLDAFPLTANGKIDRRRLPVPAEACGTAANQVAPRTVDEEAIAAIWKEVLRLNRVGIHDNFFDLGGNSLSATRAFARTNQFFGTQLALRDIFENPTIASQAEVVKKLKGSSATADRITPRRRHAVVSQAADVG